jgi:hypothetical protein
MSTDQAIQALILTASDRADLELTLRLEAWRDGWRACQQAQDNAYEHGYTDAQLDYKTIQHAAVRELALELARWDGPREHFARPRPDDVQPRARQATG